MNLRAALICLDCDEIHAGRPAACPKCGSRIVHRLWRWIPVLADRGGQGSHPVRMKGIGRLTLSAPEQEAP